MDKPLILVIEDEVKQADMIAKLIEATGRYTAIKAYNGKEGLALVKKHKPLIGENKIKLIVLDIKMPEMDGLQFLEEMRRKYNDDQIGVLMMTAYEDEEKWDRATSCFVCDYLKKPVVENELIAALDKFFSGDRARTDMTLKTFEKHIDKREEFKREKGKS